MVRVVTRDSGSDFSIHPINYKTVVRYLVMIREVKREWFDYLVIVIREITRQ